MEVEQDSRTLDLVLGLALCDRHRARAAGMVPRRQPCRDPLGCHSLKKAGVQERGQPCFYSAALNGRLSHDVLGQKMSPGGLAQVVSTAAAPSQSRTG